jgi:hypothetical protein
VLPFFGYLASDIAPQEEAASAWSLGWDAVVAVGIIALAGMTAWLAWTTRRVVAAAGDDVRAEWRPVLLLEQFRGSNVGSLLPVVYVQDDSVGVTIRNTGRGPALEVSPVIQIAGVRIEALNHRLAIPPGGTEAVVWNGVLLGDADAVAGHVTYTDLADKRYRTSFLLRRHDPLDAVEWQRVDHVPDYTPAR